MYVTGYKEEYFSCIVELEEKIYPPALRLGPEIMRAELEKKHQRSKLIFRDGELVGYIIAYTSDEVCYISDLNCTDKRALWLLLSSFFLGRGGYEFQSNDFSHYEAECRQTSLRLLYNRRFWDAIRIFQQVERKNYYCEGEHAYSVAFEVSRDKVVDLRMKIAAALLDDEGMVKLDHFQSFAEHSGMCVQDMQRYKNFVLRLMNDHNLSMYRMLGPKVDVLARKKRTFKSEYSAEQFGKALGDNGFVEDKRDYGLSPGKYCVSGKKVNYCERSEYTNAKSYGDLSSARFFFRRMYGKVGNVKKDFTVHDRFGAVIYAAVPPYCNNRTWDALMGYIAKQKRLDQRYGNESDYRYNERNRPSRYLKNLGKVIGYRDAVRLLDSIIDRNNGTDTKNGNANYIHDWNVVIERLLENAAYLTKGAFVACLEGSYNAAVKRADVIDAISASVKETLKGRRSTFQAAFMKDIRKRLSADIRSGRDLGELAKEISEKTAKLNAAKYRLTKKEAEVAEEFVRRMGRYIPYMDTVRLFSVMGKTWLKQILAGEVPCVFRSKAYALGDEKLCMEILELLCSRTKRAKRVYADLSKAGCVNAVKEKKLSAGQRAEVMRILKLRNCVVSDEALMAPDFCAKIEPKCSPEYLAAGDATVCCMGFGSHNAIDYALEEGFGILNVYFKSRIIANSVLWIDDKHNCLVLDNIEVHPNYKSYNGQIEQLYSTAVADILDEYRLSFAVQGNGYSDLRLKRADGSGSVQISTEKARKVKKQSFYSDAGSAYVVECKKTA